MAEALPTQSITQEQELRETVSYILRRMKKSEELDKKFEKQISDTENDLKNGSATLSLDLENLLTSISEIKKDLLTITTSLQAFIKTLKLKSKKKELEYIKDRIDNWKLHDLMTHDAFLREIQKE